MLHAILAGRATDTVLEHTVEISVVGEVERVGYLFHRQVCGDEQELSPLYLTLGDIGVWGYAGLRFEPPDKVIFRHTGLLSEHVHADPLRDMLPDESQ